MSGQNRQTRKVNDIAGELRVDAYLTSYSLAFRANPANFVALNASSRIAVLHESDKYAIFPRGFFWRDEAKVRPLGGRPEQVGYKVESATYLAEEWALEHTIDDRQRANVASVISLEENAVRLLESKMLIREDRIWVEKFFQAGVWANEEIGGTDFTPFNDAASEPIAVIDAQKTLMAQSTGMLPNTLVLGANVANALRSNADIVDRVKYTQRGVASLDILASLFEVERVVVARSVYNAAAEGAEDDFEFIANPNAMWLGYVDPSPGLNSATAIARFGWTGLHAGANEAGGVILRGRDDRASTDWIQTRNAFDYKVVSEDLGIFFSNANIPVSN